MACFSFIRVQFSPSAKSKLSSMVSAIAAVNLSTSASALLRSVLSCVSAVNNADQVGVYGVNWLSAVVTGGIPVFVFRFQGCRGQSQL